jgi:RimJ/RimL family protein N-acetyltransferase
MDFNFSRDPVVLRSARTHKDYALTRADCVPLGSESAAQIARVCDQPEVYQNLFEPLLKGRCYGEADASFFLNYLAEGWKDKNHFDWLILHDGVIVGTIGIKSLDGEIGYWQSNEHPGVMALAVKALCASAKLAGFASLWAHVKTSNIPSIRVLEKAGFTLDRSEREGAHRYRILL